LSNEEKMKKSFGILFLVSMVTLLTCCNMSLQDELSGVDLPLEQMNNDLKLEAPPELSTFEIGMDLGLVLINNATIPITFTEDYGIHLYQLIDDDWKPIENQMKYGNERKIIYPISEGPLIISVLPKLDSIERPVIVRVVMIGNFKLANGNIGDEVGAYVDITLPPK